MSVNQGSLRLPTFILFVFITYFWIAKVFMVKDTGKCGVDVSEGGAGDMAEGDDGLWWLSG